MENYYEMLNAGVDTVYIQAIYDVVYARKIDTITLKNLVQSLKSLDETLLADGLRTLVKVKIIGEQEKTVPITELDGQLREAIVFLLRRKHGARDSKIERDYAHLGLKDNERYRLYGNENLMMPGDENHKSRRADDIKELAIAIREFLGLYKY